MPALSSRVCLVISLLVSLCLVAFLSLSLSLSLSLFLSRPFTTGIVMRTRNIYDADELGDPASDASMYRSCRRRTGIRQVISMVNASGIARVEFFNARSRN